MGFSGDLAEQSRSMEFFMNPAHYGPFHLNSGNQRAYGCIDPRDEARGNLHIIIQTGGGAIGLGYDQAMADAAYTNEPVDLKSGIEFDSRLRLVTVATGHYVCRFLHGVSEVNNEIAHPSEMTTDSLGRLAARYGLNERTTFHRDIKIVSETAKRNQKIIDGLKPDNLDELLQTVDSSYPLHNNVGAMVGKNAAGIYIFNHHPYIGLDRAKVHRSEDPLQVQAYHSSTKASFEGLLGLTLPRELKNLRLAAFILREAATATVLIGSDPRVKILHVVPSGKKTAGIQIEQQHRAA